MFFDTGFSSRSHPVSSDTTPVHRRNGACDTTHHSSKKKPDQLDSCLTTPLQPVKQFLQAIITSQKSQLEKEDDLHQAQQVEAFDAAVKQQQSKKKLVFTQIIEPQCDADGKLGNIKDKPLMFKQPRFVIKPVDLAKDPQLQPSANTKQNSQSSAALNLSNNQTPKATKARMSTFSSAANGLIGNESKSVIVSSHQNEHETTSKESQFFRSAQKAESKNIFNQGTPFNQKHYTSAFDSAGPRYDESQKHILKYSVVGKPEWFNKVEMQNKKDVNKQQIKLNLKISKSTASVASGRTNSDNTTIVDKEINRHYVITKDHLLMKFNEIEERITTNVDKEREEKQGLTFEEQQNVMKQERCLNRYNAQLAQWEQTAESIVEHQEKYSGFLRLGGHPVNLQYKNSKRQNAEETLLLKSEQTMRQKKEQTKISEYLKGPYEILGHKNLWEGMLRNDAINMTVNHSSPKALQKEKFEYFFSRAAMQKNLDMSTPNNRKYKTEQTISLNTMSSFGRIPTISTIGNNSCLKSARDEYLGAAGERSICDEDLVTQSSTQTSLKDDQETIMKKKQQYMMKVNNDSANKSRMVTTTKGSLVKTCTSLDQLELIRTPKRILMKKIKNPNDNKEGLDQETTTDDMTERARQTSKSVFEKSKKDQQSSFLDYFSAKELDTMLIVGESKIQKEKEMILRDGKQRFETYQLAHINEEDGTVTLGEPFKQKKQQQHRLHNPSQFLQSKTPQIPLSREISGAPKMSETIVTSHHMPMFSSRPSLGRGSPNNRKLL